MSISIWRYSHLALAVSSAIFIFLASVTGIILAFQPISEQLKPYKISGFNSITLAETVAVMQNKYPEVIDLQIDANQFVLASVITQDGNSLTGYIHPKTGAFLGDKIEPSKFFQWITNFHRSLFLKGIGRFFVGLCSFFLFLIAVSGCILIIKRQRGVKKIFSKIINDNFAQYWHVVLGRLSLVPILIITLTGVYLSAEKFDLLPHSTASHQLDSSNFIDAPKQSPQDFLLFKNTKLAEVKSVEFPFSTDIEDYFTLKLKDKELVVNQFTGTVLSEIPSTGFQMFSNLSLNLHTGKGSIWWSLILAIACVNILFFIYSGFAITLKRRQTKLKNKFKKDVSKYVVLVGSENGSTFTFANALHQALLSAGESSYIAELNQYTTFKQAEHLIVITATYGAGEPPTNANKFLQLLNTVRPSKKLSFAVVGFGSYAYPDFCKFALDANASLSKIYTQTLAPFTINDKSAEAFLLWVNQWKKIVGLPEVSVMKSKLTAKPKYNNEFVVTQKTEVKTSGNDTFLVELKPKKRKHFESGDLLAVYPKNDYRERLYSMGKTNKTVQLSVKLHDHGLGSNYLNNFQVGEAFKARTISNSAFHFPKAAPKVVLIANGTGIAPFLGMLHQNTKKIETHLYYGSPHKQSFKIYKNSIDNYCKTQQLTSLHLALSRVQPKTYVQDLLKRDAVFISKTLQQNGVIMICGALAMQNDVLKCLDNITKTLLNKPLRSFENNNQIKTDCY